MEKIKNKILAALLNMLNKITAYIFTRDKPRVLIFGASQGGINVCRAIQGAYEVIGFVDNNIQLHGSSLLNKKVFSVHEIKKINYDKLIIASDYHQDIYTQLTVELGISTTLISIFNATETSKSSLFSRIDKLVSQRIDDFLCANQSLLSHYLLKFMLLVSTRFTALELKKITWLDKLDSHKVITFREQMEGLSFSPHFIGESQDATPIIVPEVNLYYFQKGRIMTAVNGVIFNRTDLALSRVPSFPITHSKYSAGFVTEHGKSNALIRKHTPEKIKQGIAIIGANDTNYYHWVIEVLNKLQFITELPEEYANYPILISEQALKIASIKTYISHLKINREFIYLESCLEYQVDELLFISSANYFVANLKLGHQWTAQSCFFRESSLKYLRDSALDAVKKSTEVNTPARIFLARKGIIRNYNQTEVFDLLSQFGFEAVYLEDLEFLQQVRLMQNADMVVGPTGAAWTNLIFCNPGTQALCWMADEIGDFSCFSNLAKFSGVDMQYFRYRTAKKDSRELYYANYSIELKMIKQWLKKVIK